MLVQVAMVCKAISQAQMFTTQVVVVEQFSAQPIQAQEAWVVVELVELQGAQAPMERPTQVVALVVELVVVCPVVMVVRA
jgi:hypothetical protein